MAIDVKSYVREHDKEELLRQKVVRDGTPAQPGLFASCEQKCRWRLYQRAVKESGTNPETAKQIHLRFSSMQEQCKLGCSQL